VRPAPFVTRATAGGAVSVPVDSDISECYLARWRGCSCLIEKVFIVTATSA